MNAIYWVLWCCEATMIKDSLLCHFVIMADHCRTILIEELKSGEVLNDQGKTRWGTK